LPLITLLFAWLLATGSHWDLVQTFAWGRMIATYSQSMSIAQAVKLTFTPDNLCGVCESVSEAKQQQQHPAAPSDGKAFGKILLVHQPSPVFVAVAPDGPVWGRRDFTPADSDRHPPPTRPPRELV